MTSTLYFFACLHAEVCSTSTKRLKQRPFDSIRTSELRSISTLGRHVRNVILSFLQIRPVDGEVVVLVSLLVPYVTYI